VSALARWRAFSLAPRARVVGDGLVVRRGPAREGEVDVFFADVINVDVASATVFVRGGRTLTCVDSPTAAAVATAIVAPAVDGALTQISAAWSAWLSGPRCARRAAIGLLALARHVEASDLHLESGPKTAVVRLRIDGELVEVAAMPTAQVPSIVAAWKGLAGCLPYRTDLVQEGRVDGVASDGIVGDVRASFVPTMWGERVALRLFGRLRRMKDLDLTPSAQARLDDVLREPAGLVVVAGATGAGKTTTMYAALAEIASRRGGAHVSLEDPVEQRLRAAGIPVDQIELDPERGRTAESMLAALLRQDVDVVAVGEVRTPAEAKLAVHAAHTGRLVWCGLHASTIDEARQRLLDLEVDPAVLGTTLRAVLVQRLVTVPCDGIDATSAGAACDDRCPRCRGRGRRRRLELSIWHHAVRRLEVA